MKTYYKVTTKFYGNGKVTVFIDEEEHEKKPKNTSEISDPYDIYEDWFTSKKEAMNWRKEALSV